MIAKQLETWFAKHQRNLPFRHQPTPYGIWVSEVMLQQTQMETVLRYYASFLKTFPTIQDLAKSSLQDVLTEVQGLGYYRRFRMLHQGATYILNHHQGVFPKTYEEVIAIPGVGAYTAGAIMAIAYNKPYAATDGNVIRVLSRYYGIKDDMRLATSKKKVDLMHQKNVETSKPRAYIQSVMELGALVCRPVNPRCETCPLSLTCYANQKQQTATLPVISKKSVVKTKEWITVVFRKGNQILLRKNTANLLKDFYLLPQWELSIDKVEALLSEQGLNVSALTFKANYRHLFTHQTWLMDVYQIEVPSSIKLEGVWVKEQALATIPIPEAHQKIIRDIFPRYQHSKAL